MSDGHVVGTLPDTSSEDAETFVKNFLEGEGNQRHLRHPWFDRAGTPDTGIPQLT